MTTKDWQAEVEAAAEEYSEAEWNERVEKSAQALHAQRSRRIEENHERHKAERVLDR